MEYVAHSVGRSRRAGLTVAVGAMIVLGLLSGEAAVAAPESPARTVKVLYSGSPRAQCARSTLDLQKSLRKRLANAGRLTPFEACVRYARRQPTVRPREVMIGTVKIRGAKATVEVTTPPPNGPEIVHLVRRAGVWKVDYIAAGQE